MSSNLSIAANQLHRHYATLIKGYIHPINHSVSKGDAREHGWRELFRRFLPAKYSVKSGFIVDAHGNRSSQVDCIIFRNDTAIELYAENDQTVVPVEVVFAAFEIKPDIQKNSLNYANDMALSISNLCLSNVSASKSSSFSSDDTTTMSADGQVITGLLADKIASTRKWKCISFTNFLKTKNVKLQVFMTIDDGCVETLKTAYPTSTYMCVTGAHALVVLLIRITEVMQKMEESRQLSKCCLSPYMAQLDPLIETAL